jgi:hypothetical protein
MIKAGTRYFANSSSGMTKRRAQDDKPSVSNDSDGNREKEGFRT